MASFFCEELDNTLGFVGHMVCGLPNSAIAVQKQPQITHTQTSMAMFKYNFTYETGNVLYFADKFILVHLNSKLARFDSKRFHNDKKDKTYFF